MCTCWFWYSTNASHPCIFFWFGNEFSVLKIKKKAQIFGTCKVTWVLASSYLEIVIKLTSSASNGLRSSNGLPYSALNRRKAVKARIKAQVFCAGAKEDRRRRRREVRKNGACGFREVESGGGSSDLGIS